MRKTILSHLSEFILQKNLRIIVIVIFFSGIMEANAQRKVPDYTGDTITFCGYRWVTKDSKGKHTGPGNNYFSGSERNVYVDNSGKLHMRVTFKDDKWYCPEVRLLENLGYGKYYFYVEPLPQPLDKDVVIGLFLYDREDTNNYHKEVDIEISSWGQESPVNTQFVIQPKESEAYRFETDLTKCSVHMFDLTRKHVHFKSYYPPGEFGKKKKVIASNKVIPDYEYFSENEKVFINVWLYHSVEPASLQEFEVVINSFVFEPACTFKIPFVGKGKK